MKLSIIIPVYNEEKTLEKILDKVINVKLKVDKEIIIVNDCSNNLTNEILKKYESKVDKIVNHDKNLGKGRSNKNWD